MIVQFTQNSGIFEKINFQTFKAGSFKALWLLFDEASYHNEGSNQSLD